MGFYYGKSIHFEGQSAGGGPTADRTWSSGWGYKCVTVDKSSSQGDGRRERPWGGEVEADFAKWPRAIIKAYMLRASVLLP